MHKDFFRVFQSLQADFTYANDRYDRFMQAPSAQQAEDLVGETRTAIEKAVAKNTNGFVKLRPDARYFLLLNFCEMFLFPLLAAKKAVIDEEFRAKMLDDLNRNLSLVLSDAAKKQEEDVKAGRDVHNMTEEGEINLRNVMRSICDLWDDIKFNEE